MARDFKELEAKMSPESRARAHAKARELMAEMLLAEIRKFVGLTQEDLAAALGITQPSLSKLENQDDMHVSTLRRLKPIARRAPISRAREATAAYIVLAAANMAPSVRKPAMAKPTNLMAIDAVICRS